VPPKKETEDPVGTMIGLVKKLEQVPGAPAAPQIRQDIVQHKKVNPQPQADAKARLINETTIFWDTYYKLKSRYEGDPSKGRTKMEPGSPAGAAVGTAGAALAGTAAVAGGVAAGGGGMGLWGMLLTAGGLWLALKLLKKNPKVKAALEDIGGMMWDKVKEGWDWFKKQFPELGYFLEGIGEKAEEIWDGLTKKFEEFWDGLKKEYPEFFAWVEEFQTKLGKIWDDLGKRVKSIWDGIKEKYKEIKDSISKFFDKVGEVPSNIGEWITNIIEKGLRTAGEYLKTHVFGPVLDDIAFLIDKVLFLGDNAAVRGRAKERYGRELFEQQKVEKKLEELEKRLKSGAHSPEERKILMLEQERQKVLLKQATELAIISKKVKEGNLGPGTDADHSPGHYRLHAVEKNKIALEEFRKRIKEEQGELKKAGKEMVKLDDFLGFGNKLYKINTRDQIMGAKAGGPISAFLGRGTGGGGVANTIAGYQLHEAKRTNVLLEALVIVTKSLSKVGGGVSEELGSLLDTLAKSSSMGNSAPQTTQFDDSGPMGESTNMTSSRLAYYQSPHSLNTPLPWGSA